MPPSPVDIDLSQLSVVELRKLLQHIDHALQTQRFEEGMNKALQEYQSRDPRVIRC